MSETPVNPEEKPLIHLQKLNVLIHPLWKIEPGKDDSSDHVRFDSERRKMAAAILDQLSPNGQSEATYFMPLVYEPARWDSLRNQIRKIKADGKYIQWPDLYRDMVKKVGHGRNLIFGTNLVGSHLGIAPPPKYFMRDLKKRGFSIDENTQIEVGGELLGACLQIGVDHLLELPEIRKVKVNLDATLTSGYIFGTPMNEQEREKKDFIRDFLTPNKFDVSQEGNTITIAKKATKSTRA